MVEPHKVILKPLFIATLFASAITYYVRLYLARNLTLEQFGLFYAVLSLVVALFVLKHTGLNQAIAKYLPQYNVKKQFTNIADALNSVFVFQLIISFILVAIL